VLDIPKQKRATQSNVTPQHHTLKTKKKYVGLHVGLLVLVIFASHFRGRMELKKKKQRLDSGSYQRGEVTHGGCHL
jgi:hypothetical protein